MEDDVQETPLPFRVSETDGGRVGRENTPRLQTTGSAHNALAPFSRSLYGADSVRRLPSTPAGTTADSQVRLHDLIFFPGGDSGFAARTSPASELTAGEKEDEGKWPEREEERLRVEMQVGRRLRLIGDLFQHQRMRRFMRYRREWEDFCWHLATMLFIFLYPREFLGN